MSALRKIVPIARYWSRPRAPRPLSPSERFDAKAVLDFAEGVGYAKGAANLHYEDRTFATGAEYLRWLAGWRRGYAEFLQARAEEEVAAQARNEFMREQLR